MAPPLPRLLTWWPCCWPSPCRRHRGHRRSRPRRPRPRLRATVGHVPTRVRHGDRRRGRQGPAPRHRGAGTVAGRVVDAVRKAGGARAGVDLTPLNLARPLVDGEQILVGVAVPVSASTGPAADPGVRHGGGTGRAAAPQHRDRGRAGGAARRGAGDGGGDPGLARPARRLLGCLRRAARGRRHPGAGHPGPS